MKECAVTNMERRSEPRKQVRQYYKRGILNKWTRSSLSIQNLEHRLNVHVRSGQGRLGYFTSLDILPRLNVGDTLNMKYYSTDSVYPSNCLQTAIKHITKNDQGRFKGHYLVGLEIQETQH